MAHNPEEYCRLRRKFIEAAAKYELAGYNTFIQRTARSEEGYYESGRNVPVALIRWPYRPWRKCWILAPVSGTNEEPFSTMKTLFSKAWLWLPRVIAEGVVDTAERHLSPPADLGLYWARSHYQFWCWLLWFDWLRRCREVETEEPEVPSAGMDLPPFSSSADLIARWGLDGSAGTIPVWLAPPPAPAPEPQPPAKPTDAGREDEESANNTAAAKKPKRSTEQGEGREKLIPALTKHHDYANGSCLNLEPIGNNELARLAGVARSTASEFFKAEFGGHKRYKAACLNEDRQWKIVTQLKVLNDEFSVFRSLDGDPSGDDGQEPERDDGE